MNRRNPLLLVAALILVTTPVFAAVTTIENDVLVKGDDPRLDQKVTLSADGLCISEVLSKLSQTSGVTLDAGTDKDDWMVQDRKVVAYVTDMPLRALMQELGSILRFQWSREGDQGKWSYRLWQDKQLHNEEVSLRAAAQNAQTVQYRQKRENAIADIVNLGSLGQGDAAKLKATDPWRYILATEPLGRDVADFFNSFPDARNAFIQGQDMGFSIGVLSPELKATVRRIAVSYDSLGKSIGNAQDDSRTRRRHARSL